MRINLTKIGIIAIATLTSCDLLNPKPETSRIYEDGYFVTNEGNFGQANGSISFVNKVGVVENDVFAITNSFPLGDVVQSMSIIDNKSYILVNGSGKIEVTDIDSMTSVTTIDVSGPRYIAKVDNSKAYVTDWGINGVHVIDLNTNEIISTISTGTGPEAIAVSDGYAFICNIGGWGLDNTVSVIDISSDAVISNLEVGDKPNSAVVDINGDVWVLTGGYTEYDANWNVVSETSGNLVKISNNSIVSTFTFSVGNHPEDLVINKDGNTLYYSDGSWSKAIFSFNISDTSLSNTPLINKSFYGLASDENYIYGSDAVDFSQNGWSFKYNSEGTLIDSVQVGIIPGGYCFN